MADWAEGEIAATTPEHLDGFHRAFDSVARERIYLTFLEAPPLSETREYALGLLRAGNPHFVALAEGEVVGWCDIARFRRPSEAHRGRLGMGIVAAYRSRGVGRRLIEAALRRARNRADAHRARRLRRQRPRHRALRESRFRQGRLDSRCDMRRRRVSRRDRHGAHLAGSRA